MISRDFIRWWANQSADVKYQTCRMTARHWYKTTKEPGVVCWGIILGLVSVGVMFLLRRISL